MATQDEMELAKLVNRLVKASQAKDARIAGLEAALGRTMRTKGDPFEVIKIGRENDSLVVSLVEKLQESHARIAALEAALQSPLTADDIPTEGARKPATLQAPDPAMTLGAAAEPDAPLLGVLLPDGKWAELTTGQVHNGHNPYIAAMVAANHDGEVVDVKEHFGATYSIRDSRR